MDATRWDELETIFGQALALPPGQRPAFLEKACKGDAALRSELDSLLDHYDEAPGYFDDLAEAVPMPVLPFTNNPAPARNDPYQIEGATISHYRVLEKLGGGGMGVVYKAQDTKLGRIAALKFLPPHLHADDRAKERFIAEAKAASALDHPNICTIYEIGETDTAQLFIAMACYDGQTLKKKIKSGTLSTDEALDIATQIARGLAKAHGKSIVHRDIKPANVIVTADGVVKILDFGLAKMADVQLTQTGTTMGTIAYMSPEQTRGETVDHRTDVWSLGVVLYEMITGTRPFKGDYDQAIVYSILHEAPTPLTEADPSLPEALEHVVAMCLEKDRALRYPSTADLLADLEVLTHHSGSASTSVTSAALRAMQQRRSQPRKLIALGGGVLLALAAVLAYFVLRPSTPAGAEAEASAPEIHLAVMPFTDSGATTTDPAYREGLRLTLTSVLTRMSQYTDVSLWIVPASEIDEAMKIAEARQLFGVNRVIRGRVRQDSNQVSLDLDLSETEPIRQRRSVSVPVTESDDQRTSMEAGLVSGLAELLEIPLTPQARRALTAGGTADSRAYEYYLKGRAALERIDQPESITSAIQLFSFALEEDSLYALAYAGLGRAYVYQFEQTKDTLLIARVEDNSRRALGLDDRLAEARMTLGLLYVKTGAYDEAIREYDLALLLDSTNADIFLDKAYVYEQLTRVDEAEAVYLQGLKIRPDYHRLYNKLGHLYLRNQRYEEAADQFLTITKLTPDNIWGYNNLGAVHLYQKQYDEARVWFERSNAIQPNFMASSNLGTIAFDQQQYHTAARMQEQALALDASDYQVWGNLARAYSRIPEERTKAFETYQKTIELAEAQHEINPNNPRVRFTLARYYLRLGLLYYDEGDHTNEARMYEQSLTYQENSSVVWNNLANAYGRIPEERHKARPAYQRAVQAAETERETTPDDEALLHRLVGLYLQLEQPRQARPILEKALALNPDHVDLMVQAGRLYEQLDDRETALGWIEKALQNGYLYDDIEDDSTFDALRADPRFQPIRDQTSSPS